MMVMLAAVLVRRRRTIRAMSVRIVHRLRVAITATHFLPRVLFQRTLVEVRSGRTETQSGERAENENPLQEPEHHAQPITRIRFWQAPACSSSREFRGAGGCFRTPTRPNRRRSAPRRESVRPPPDRHRPRGSRRRGDRRSACRAGSRRPLPRARFSRKASRRAG